jgi:hypothetical protein
MRKKKGYLLLATFLLCHQLFSQLPFAKGLDFDDAGYMQVKKKAKLTRSLETVPAAYSLKQYAPIPKNQGMYGTCAAWASAYCGRTMVEAIKQNWTDKQYITDRAFSPAFLFRLIKPTDSSCRGGATISSAFETMRDKGTLSFLTAPATCIPEITAVQLTEAVKTKIKDFMRLFDAEAAADIKIQSVKKSIAEKKPVVFGMICPQSFAAAKMVWNPTEQPNKTLGGHALCVVGYDDAMEGGAFEVQNSWGRDWGNQGYTWIRYTDFAKFTMYAYEFIDLPEPKPQVPDLSGSIKLVLANGNTMPANLLVSTRGLSVVPAKPAAGPLTLYKTVQAYTSGTRFRIYLSNNEPAYVYAFSTDLSNAVTKIFPYDDNISAALTDRKNDVAIPDEDHYIEFDEKPGRDFLCVLYTRKPLNINEVIKKISELPEGSFSEKIFKVVGNDMVDPKNIRFSPDTISFTGISDGKNIAAMLVELEHK